MKVNDNKSTSLDDVKVYTVSSEAMGLGGLSKETNVKIRKRTRKDFE